jgi:hypothetical protein
MNDKLSEILDLDPIPEQSTTVLPTTTLSSTTVDNTIVDDATYARENIRGLIENSVPTLQNLIKIANDSQHPRAYEVVTQLVKTISDLNKDLMEIHKKEQDLTKPETPAGTASGINVKNAVFVGTTRELREHLKQS